MRTRLGGMVLGGACLAMGIAAQGAPISKEFISPAPPDHALAQQVLSLALENQYRGQYQADLEVVRSSYLGEVEKWTGTIRVDQVPGEKIIEVRNGKEGFTYRSAGYGTEQWLLDQGTQRMRRIANRQFKKPALGTVLSFEDWQKLPLDLLRENHGFRSFRQTDSTYEIGLVLGRSAPSFYSRADAVITRMPLLVKSMTLYDNQGKPCKQVEIGGYSETGGKWMLQGFRVMHCDSSASTWVAMKNTALPDTRGLARADHAWSAPKASEAKPTLATPRLEIPRKAGVLAGDLPKNGEISSPSNGLEEFEAESETLTDD